MDRIEKVLVKLNEKERERVKYVLEQILSKNFQGLDIKKLKGRESVFRARRGDIRIVFRVSSERKIFVLFIERRSERTYKH